MEIVTISVVEATETVTINVTEGFGSVTNSDATYNATVNVSETLVLPDITHTNTDGTPTILPAQTPMVCTPAACSGADVENSDSTYSQHVNDGDTLMLPDTIVKNTLGTTILTQPSATSTGVIADSVVTNSDATFSLNVPAESNPVLADITHIDSDGTPVVYPSAKAFTCTSAVQTYASARVMKTGQTTSYRTGDDGDLEAGREDSFLVLKENNPFGNTNRFTDELGGATYTNNIVIDWSTFDGVSVLGWDRRFNGGGVNADKTWENAIDEALGHSNSTFLTGWRLPNYYEYSNIFKFSELNVINYAPFSLAIGYTLWTSTTQAAGTINAFFVYGPYGLGYQPKTSSSGYRWIAVRTFTVSETTLT